MTSHIIQLDGLDAVELRHKGLRLVLVTGIGPRIAFFGRENGKNLLYWNIEGDANGEEWKLYGGHRVWITRPGADESVDTYAADNLPCAVEIGPNSVTAAAPVHPFTKLERSIRVEALKDGGFAVENRVRNAGNLIYSGGVWSPTCINPEDKILRIPLGDEQASWDAVTVVTPRVFAGNVVRLDDPQVQYEGMDLVIRSQGHVTKRCAQAAQGKVIMDWPAEKLRFVKQADFCRGAAYPLNGCNTALFVGENNWMGELETFGPEQSIYPGETISNREKWQILAL